MRHLRFLATTALGVALGGCGTEPHVCTTDFVTLTTTVVNGTAQPLVGLSVTDTVLRSGAVLHVQPSSLADTVPAHGAGRVMLISDRFREAIATDGDDVIVVVSAGDHTGSGHYRFGGICHVEKLAGPDTLVVR